MGIVSWSVSLGGGADADLFTENRWGMSPFAGRGADPGWEAVNTRAFLAPTVCCSPVQAAFAAAYAIPEVHWLAVGTDRPVHLDQLVAASRLPLSQAAIDGYRRRLTEATACHRGRLTPTSAAAHSVPFHPCPPIFSGRRASIRTQVPRSVRAPTDRRLRTAAPRSNRVPSARSTRTSTVSTSRCRRSKTPLGISTDVVAMFQTYETLT